MKTLEKREREKYARMWSVSNYDKVSPGLNIAPTAVSELGIDAGDSLYDFGCGKCHAVKWFRDRGIHAVGIDHVALVEGVVEACLWRLPELPVVDWAFSADVMEHIPPEKIDDVIDGIVGLSARGAFFQIATRPDRMGKLIGETLHLTVEPREWWVSRLKRRWSNVTTGQGAVDWQFWAVCT